MRGIFGVNVIFSLLRDGDYEFSVMCAAQGKPKPSVRWTKNGQDVSSKLFDIMTDPTESELKLVR